MDTKEAGDEVISFAGFPAGPSDGACELSFDSSGRPRSAEPCKS